MNMRATVLWGMGIGLAVFFGIAGCEENKTAKLQTSPADRARSNTSAADSRLDLRTQAGRGAYTLQVGYYDANFGNDFRQAAEKAAKVLRDDGQQAYYYHGPNVSLVTIGVFGADAVATDPNSGQTVYGAEVIELRTQFPHHMANGREVIQYMPNGTKVREGSRLVRIPAPKPAWR